MWSKGEPQPENDRETKDVTTKPHQYKNEATFTINGKKYTVSDAPVDTTLNRFIRDRAHLKGTKYMCKEGGCGCCVVAVTISASQGQMKTFSVNSCLVPVYTCHGWSIETVEGIGNKFDGYHEVQSRLAIKNGSQCGFCSPGMVMNMYSLLKSKKTLTMKEIEDSFGGNICRCTGYRPILDAFKSFGSDAPKELTEGCSDIEDLKKVCSKMGKDCIGHCKGNCSNHNEELPYKRMSTEQSLRVKAVNITWYSPNTLQEIFEILQGVDDYKFVAGNTANGVYRPTYFPKNYIYIGNVLSLQTLQTTGDSMVIGANVTFTDVIAFFYTTSAGKKNTFGYADVLAKHIEMIAGVSVRNVATLAGSLATKYEHQDFVSDIYLIFETVGAQLVIDDGHGLESTVSLPEYLITDMDKKIITKIILPSLDSSYVCKSYRVAKRNQNAVSYVNAGFLFKLNKNNKYKVLEKPTIVFGGINSNFDHAVKTENFLNGKKLLDPETVTLALKVLSEELKPNNSEISASPEYRKGLAISLLYKFFLSLFPDQLSPRIKSGGQTFIRPVSSSKQTFTTNELVWPVNKPVTKLEAFHTCSGEAQYVNDMHNLPGELFAVPVIAKQGPAASFKLDPSEALKLNGVAAFYTTKDIPGKNDIIGMFVTAEMGYASKTEELFPAEKILYAGQPLGVILADTPELASEAAEKVKVEYVGLTKPIIDMLDVIKSQDKSRLTEITKFPPILPGPPTDTDIGLFKKVTGNFSLGGQYHYTMETQTCYCVPSEDGLDVYPSTQWHSLVQASIATVLNIKQNSINVHVRRVGGAYGSRISRSCQVSTMCALAAYLSKRPVRLVLDMETNMQMVGKRCHFYIDYEVHVDFLLGKILFLKADFYMDMGALINETKLGLLFLIHLVTPYTNVAWSLQGYGVRTDKPPNTWCRGPGSTEATAALEHIMDHIASVLNKDPTAIKLLNLSPLSLPLVKIISDIKASSDYETRLEGVKSFNKQNRWKKRGISLGILNYPLQSLIFRYHANVSIFVEDGTVVVTHGGVECGQGINTKTAQVCAYTLGIPLSYVSVKPISSSVAPNDTFTGGSVTSEAVCAAVKNSCEQLNLRLAPIKAIMIGSNWEDVVRAAYKADIDLNATYMFSKKDELIPYFIYAATVIEVEIDVLTGENQIVRADILEDAGQSLSPSIDVGQIEGAFVMGLGYHLMEELIYNNKTGRLLTDRTWTYKVPGAEDIPIDFRVELLPNSINPVGVLSSKATGEPALNLAYNVIGAIRNALKSAREDAGQKEDWLDLDHPLTREHIWLTGLTSIDDMTL